MVSGISGIVVVVVSVVVCCAIIGDSDVVGAKRKARSRTSHTQNTDFVSLKNLQCKP
jgi:hypothetical protein